MVKVNRISRGTNRKTTAGILLILAAAVLFYIPLVAKMGVPRLIIGLFFIMLCLLAMILGLSLPSQLSNTLVRLGMNGVLVLAMLPGIQCGISLNLGLPIGIIGGLIGGLLCMGVGDTLRVSLTADPVEEVIAAKRILQAAGIRRSGPDLISCPTCGRTKYDMIPIAREVERRLKDCAKPITVAVMGCVVNGPGEASGADVGIAGGKGEGLLFAKGKILRKVPQEQLVDALFQEIDKL